MGSPSNTLPSSQPGEALPPHPDLHQYYTTKLPFIRRVFDEGATDYDRIERLMALGSGSWYRRKALERAGLRVGMRVLDVAVGTGMVAREAVSITGNQGMVVGVDPSEGMLAQARVNLSIPVIRGIGEHLPIDDSRFDFVSMGYALRHLTDIREPFREFHRVLRPGGSACILEITRPPGQIRVKLLKLYMKYLIPALSRLGARGNDSPLLWQYYWDTIEACIAPEQVMAAMRDAGFIDVRRHVELGIFSEYTGRKPE